MSDWRQFDCPGASARWRLVDGRIEIEGEGAPIRPFPPDVEQWRAIIDAKGDKYNLPPIWIAAIMALETGGRPGLCRKNPDGSCSHREGMGLMAMLLSTASFYAGRKVSEAELLGDYDLQIDLGAKMLADLRDRYDGDFVKAAIAYNAGRIRCGNGRTWERPHEPCPPTPWGVVMGCVRTTRAVNVYCRPSAVSEGMFACPGDYPRVAISYFNAAAENGWGEAAPRPAPPPEPPSAPRPPLDRARAVAALPFVIGAAAGFAGLRWLLPRL